MLEADVRTFLLAQPTVTALIGTRFYPLRLPQGPTFPAVTYQTIFGTSLVTHQGAADYGRRRLQLDCWAQSYAVAVAIKEAIREALLDDPGLEGTRIINDMDVPEPEPVIWRRMLEISIWHTEA